MPTCVICKKDIGFLGSLTFDKKTNRCGSCLSKRAKNLERFRGHFSHLSKTEQFSDKTFQFLYKQAEKMDLNWQESLHYIRKESIWFLERYITFAFSDGIMSEQEFKYFIWLKNNLKIPPNLSTQLDNRVKYLRSISNIRLGNLPNYTTNTHLESDEICHLEMNAIYEKVNLRSTRLIQGRFVVTNKRINFLSQDGGWRILYKNVMRVQNEGNGIFIELAVKSGNGFYQVSDALLAEAILDTQSKIFKRQLLTPNQDNNSRHIPQEVKTSVWQRDNGKCVQCGSQSYLEFDHIIPFSKGGANTLNNIQLLCRSCNQIKGNKI